jgi:DMSO/TMAO reductase YedYZ heme-binding membrane subunit
MSARNLLTYLGPDQSFSLAGMWLDVAKRPFITVGFLAFVLLIPLAVTSTAGWIRKLGGKGWARLHQLVYMAAILGVIHYDWLVKSDKTRPLIYGANSHRSPSLAAGQFYENPVAPAINRDSAGGGVSHPNWV